MTKPVTRTTALNLIRILQLPWECAIDDTPRTMCYDIEKMFENRCHLSGNLFLHATYRVIYCGSAMNRYRSVIEIEARNKEIAMTIGEIKNAEIVDDRLRLTVMYNQDNIFMEFIMM